MIIPVGKDKVYFNDTLVRDLQERVLINDFKDERTLNGKTVRQWLDAFCSYMAKECKKDIRKEEWTKFLKCLNNCQVKVDRKEEPVKEQFDFEKWWDRDRFCVWREIAHGNFAKDTMGIEHIFSHLTPLYDKMREWGFENIWVDFGSMAIRVRTKVSSYNFTDGEGMNWTFPSISDFPRALHDAFKWMYENRVNKKFCADCGKELGNEMYSDDFELAQRIKIGENSYRDKWKTKSDKLFCPECHYKRHPKQKCDNDGPCAKWLENFRPNSYVGCPYCPYRGEKRNP